MKLEKFEELLDYENKIEFDDIKNKLSIRRDLHAFLLLNSLVPEDNFIIGSAEHDKFWINTDIDKLLEVITEEQVKELGACGVMYDEGSLCMFA